MIKLQGALIFKIKIHLWIKLVLIHFFCFSIASYAQKKPLKFTHFGKQDGLNQSSVNYIHQDSKGFLWIANFGGINRFDGYEFVSYSNSFKDSLSLADNSVWTILEKKDQTLWFGTKTGLSKYNEATDNFSNYVIKDLKNSSATLAVKTLFEDKKGRFYVGSEGKGLFTFSTASQTFIPEKLIPTQAKITSITEDMYSNLWVATENAGLFQLSPDRSTVIEFDTANILKDTTIWNVYADEYFIWIGTDNKGVIRYNSKENSFLVFNTNPNYSIGNKVTFITKSQGLIWVASATEGLSYYSYSENKFYNYQKDAYDTNSLFDNNVSGLFSGQNNALYVGFYMKGFDKVISTPFNTLKHNPKKKNTLSNDNVYCMYKDKEDILWLGTFGGGLNKYNPKTKEFTNYSYDPKDSKSLSHDWIRIIYEDKKETLWIGTWGGGLNKFDKKTGESKRYLPNSAVENSLNHNIVTAVFEDSDGELWIGTYGGGINIYQRETDDFKSLTHNAGNKNSISDDHITSFYEDAEGKIWICTYGGGLNSYNKKTEKFKRYMPKLNAEYSLNSYKTLHIYEEPGKDYFWITTLGGGINKFYYKENKFLNYTEADGLSNNSTMGMLKDNLNTYWVSSNNGISRFNPDAETFTNYTTIDGLGSDDFNLEAFAKTSDGTMYFGGKNGITYFNPNTIDYESTFPTVEFTEIKTEGKSYTTIPQEINIPYKSRATFKFAAINPNKTESITYSYQLVGQDKKWLTLGKNRYLEFTNLNPGNYELRVKSTNSDKKWNADFTSIKLKVPTPWYLTDYFKAIVLLILIASIYSYNRIKLSRVKKQNRILEKKVQERTETIQEKNIDLQLEKEKTEDAYKQLKKLEGFKNEFTSMLAHDLKNPLVTILGYSSESSQNADLKSINKSGKTMLNLIENMLEVQKFENASVQLNINRCNLKGMASSAIKQVEVLFKEKRIQIINTINPEIMVDVDKDIIERVFINLLSNAIKFSSSDSKIEILMNEGTIENSLVKVTVKDYGTGIPKDRLAIVFSKFSQVKAKKSGTAKSTGLGLTFCKMAIEAHKCEIGVLSEIDRGSEFYFYLPRSEDSIIEGNTENKVEGNDSNPLNSLVFTLEDMVLMKRFNKKIDILEIYETGEWLTIFDEIDDDSSRNIQKWKQMMMEAITNFDEKAFLHLKKVVSLEVNQ